MICIMPVFFFIYDVIFTIWNILQTFIVGVRTYTPIVYNFVYVFTETLYDTGLYDDDEPVSPKKTLIDKSWCDIDTSNIIEHQDKKKL